MSERRDNEAAYVLHTRPWRESSLIVDVLSRRHGRLALVARGARRPMSALKSRLLAFQPLLLSWFGKGTLRTLHAAEWQGGDPGLRARALMCGFYLNELLLRLLPADDPHEALYERYAITLGELAAGGPAEAILRRFELDLLSELGYAQTLDRLADGTPVRAEGSYGYVLGTGVVAAGGEIPVRGRTLLGMAAGDYRDPQTLAEAKALMRLLIHHYLGEKPLLTRQLLRDLSGLSSGAEGA